MNDINRKPMNHGEIVTVMTPRIPGPYIPRALKSFMIIEQNLERDVAAKKYGVWEMLAVKDLVCRGQFINAGEKFSCTGDLAIFFGQPCPPDYRPEATFIEGAKRDAQERALIESAKQLGLPERLEDLAAFKF